VPLDNLQQDGADIAQLLYLQEKKDISHSILNPYGRDRITGIDLGLQQARR
jgi:hypothetical protein